MENIEIKRNKNKRSIESLIDQSALDNSFNYEAHQLRKAFNQTLLAMNNKNAQREREIEKYKIILREYEENKNSYEHRIGKLQEQLSVRNEQYQEMSDSYKQTKKRLNYLQYKFQNLSENRNLFDQRDSYEEQNESKAKRKLKNDIYNELNRTIVKKIDYFTKDIKKLTMSADVEQRIQSFLEELLYLNPYSEFHILDQIKQPNENHFGKIKKDHTVNITSQEEWKRLQKSLQKLKEVNKRSPLIEQANPIQQSKRQKSLSKRRRLFK